MLDYSQPARRYDAVTKSDSTVFNMTSAIYVGGGGDVAVSGPGGTVTFVGVLAGSIIPIEINMVLDTGTTATEIIALGR